MALSPIPLTDATALLIAGSGWADIVPGSLQFIQQAVMGDENGNPIPLPEPWVQFVDGGGQAQGYPWRAVNGVKLAVPAQPLG